MSKEELNKHRQTKEYFVPKVDYKYVSTKDRNFKDRVIALRRKHPNDEEFGAAVAKLLLDNNTSYPGVQNL